MKDMTCEKMCWDIPQSNDFKSDWKVDCDCDGMAFEKYGVRVDEDVLNVLKKHGLRVGEHVIHAGKLWTVLAMNIHNTLTLLTHDTSTGPPRTVTLYMKFINWFVYRTVKKKRNDKYVYEQGKVVQWELNSS